MCLPVFGRSLEQLYKRLWPCWFHHDKTMRKPRVFLFNDYVLLCVQHVSCLHCVCVHIYIHMFLHYNTCVCVSALIIHIVTLCIYIIYVQYVCIQHTTRCPWPAARQPLGHPASATHLRGHDPKWNACSFLPGRSTRERHLRAKENGESPRCQMSNTSNHDHNNDNNNNNDINNNNNNNDNSSSKYDKNKNERIIVILMIIILRIKNSKLRKFALKNRPTQLGDSGCSPTFSTWHGTWFACGGSSQRKHHSCLTRVELHHPHVFLQNMSKHLSLVNCHSISTPWVVMWFTHIYIYIFYIYIYTYIYII